MERDLSSIPIMFSKATQSFQGMTSRLPNIQLPARLQLIQ